MIDPKYAELPGIAYDQPDIYETDGCPEDKQFINYSQEDENAIEKIYITASDAFNKFKDKRFIQKTENFFGRFQSKIGCSEFHSVGLAHKDEIESPLQKYKRIKSEIQEFLDQANLIKENLDENEESKSLIEIIYQIEKAGKELDAMNINTLFETERNSSLSQSEELRFKELLSQIELFKRKTNSEKQSATSDIHLPINESLPGFLKYKMVYYPEKAKIQNISRLSHLEKRIGCIENLIGCSENSSTKCCQLVKLQGITQTIEKLMANTCLLNSAQLDTFENKVTSLLNKMDSAAQKKNVTLPDTKYERVILDLYDVVKKSEMYYQILPQIIDRLLSLNRLHQKAADFANQLKELQKLQQSIDIAMLHNKTVLEEIQKNFSNNFEIISKDIITLKDHIKIIKS